MRNREQRHARSLFVKRSLTPANRQHGKKINLSPTRDMVRRERPGDVDGSTEDIDLSIVYYSADDDSAALALLSNASVQLITTSVGASNLPEVGALLARAIHERRLDRRGMVQILACENLRNNSVCLRRHVEGRLLLEDRAYFEDSVIFLNTVVDRVCARVVATQ